MLCKSMVCLIHTYACWSMEVANVGDLHPQSVHGFVSLGVSGMFGPLEIGNVYATDPDDWDVVDKTFKYTGPEYMKKYFS